MYSKKFLSTIPLLLIAISMILPINIISLASTQELFDLQVQTGGKAGTTLSAYVTASTIHLTIHNWEIGKTANATEVYLSEENPEATVEYTVKVAKTTTYSYYIEGYVCVENGGDRSTQGLTIMLDIYAEPPWSNQIINDYPVDVSSHPVLHPGQEYCYGFIVPLNGFESYDEFKITANVTILNHSGHLGVPYGPTPSTTIHTITYQVSGYNCITVVDTNGYTWYTCESGRWIYDLTFEYDPKMGGSYEHVNTATIYETGQSASWTVIVSQVIKIMEFATISGIVFWDNNYNGEFNQGADKPIMGVPIELYKYDEEGGWIYEGTAYSGSDGYYYFYNIELGYQYKVVASKPVCEFCDKVISTTPMNYEINVEEAKTYDKNDFGFVCLKMLTGAKSKGYWSWSQYNKRTGQWQTRITSEDLHYVNSELGTNFISAKELADFLVSPVYGNMSMILMQQLIATLLNLKYGFISGDTIIHYNSSYISINSIVDNAKTALQSGSRCEQEYWKGVLDAINNNNVFYVYRVNC